MRNTNKRDFVAENDSEFLTIFHMDMNFVSLREDYIRVWLKRLVEMGYNAILWELEDKVQWETCPEVVCPEAMTKDMFRSILEYSHKLGLESIPLLQTVGHGEYVMKHKPYTAFREQADRIDCYCTSNPSVRAFLKEFIGEYLGLFGKLRYFHLGGDEAYVFGSCPACKAAADKTCRNQLYADHIMDIAQPIFAKGIRPGIWCDMILHYPQKVQAISKDLVIWDWNYWDGVSEPESVMVWGKGQITKDHLDEQTRQSLPEIMDGQGHLRGFYTVDVIQRLGYDVFLCSASRSSGDTIFCGRHGLHSGNIVGAAKKAVENKLLGHCVTSWAVRIFNLELQGVWLRLAGLGNENSDEAYEDIIARAGAELFGVDAAEFFEAAELAATPFPFVVSGSSGDGSCLLWNALKDPEPAPEGYIAGILKRWKDSGVYEEKKAGLVLATERISEGLSRLQAMAAKVTSTNGKQIMKEWLLAADFQFRMTKVAGNIFSKFENEAEHDVKETLAELNQIKSDFERWAKHWMTPQCASHNAGLIFDPIIAGYFG